MNNRNITHHSPLAANIKQNASSWFFNSLLEEVPRIFLRLKCRADTLCYNRRTATNYRDLGLLAGSLFALLMPRPYGWCFSLGDYMFPRGAIQRISAPSGTGSTLTSIRTSFPASSPLLTLILKLMRSRMQTSTASARSAPRS